MNCPTCDTQTDDAYCLNCGTQLAVAGPRDPITNLPLAGWGQRVGATFVDYLVMLIPEYLLKVLLGSVGGSIVFYFLFAAYLITQWLIYDGRTVGNRVLHTQIRDAAQGGSITNKQALWRYFFLEAYIIFDIVGVGSGGATLIFVAFVYLLVDLLFPLWDSRKQTVHDRFANTIVIRTR